MLLQSVTSAMATLSVHLFAWHTTVCAEMAEQWTLQFSHATVLSTQPSDSEALTGQM